MSVTYFTQRPSDLAYYMAKSRLDNRRKFRVIIAVADNEGRTLELSDETVSLKALNKVRTAKPRVVIANPNHILANSIHPHSWTVVLQQDDTIAVRTVPFLAPKRAK